MSPEETGSRPTPRDHNGVGPQHRLLAMSPVVTLQRVSKMYTEKRALDRVSLTIRPGEFVAVIGRSGAGKTTLLRCLSCATTATSGTIRMGETDLATLRGTALRQYRARVGMIYQQFNLVKRLRVIDNVLVGRLPHLRGWPSWAAMGRVFDQQQREIARYCLHHVGLLDRMWQRTDTLSGGEQQRVAIAKILAQEPRLILADEPVASLDMMNGALVMETLRRIASEAGLTVITNLHHVEYARRYTDRVVGLCAGQVVFDGPPSLLTETALRSIFGEFMGDAAGSTAVAMPEVP